MLKYNHAYTLGFEVISHKRDGSDVTQDMFVAALLQRIADLVSNNEMGEAVGTPDDTMLDVRDCKE